MIDTFENRVKGEEAKFKQNDELRFKIDARRNRMLGQWAAEKLGLASAEAEAFTKRVVHADLKEKGCEDVICMVAQEFRDGGLDISDDQIRAELNRLQLVAEEEIQAAYPKPLGDDHGRVGD